MLGGGDERLRVHLLARLACAWRSSPERRNESAALSLQAVQLARTLDDPVTLSYALAGRYWAIWWPENPIERHPLAPRRCLRSSRRSVTVSVWSMPT